MPFPRFWCTKAQTGHFMCEVPLTLPVGALLSSPPQDQLASEREFELLRERKSREAEEELRRSVQEREEELQEHIRKLERDRAEVEQRVNDLTRSNELYEQVGPHPCSSRLQAVHRDS